MLWTEDDSEVVKTITTRSVGCPIGIGRDCHVTLWGLGLRCLREVVLLGSLHE